MFNVLAVVCIFLAAGLFLFDGFSGDGNKRGSDTGVKSDQVGDQINYRLQSADRKKKLRELRLENLNDNETLSGVLEEDLKTHNLKMPKGLDDRIDTTLDDVYQDLNLGRKEMVTQKLTDEVQRSIDELRGEGLEESEQELFIRSFIENARKRGLKIEIDEDLNVYTK